MLKLPVTFVAALLAGSTIGQTSLTYRDLHDFGGSITDSNGTSAIDGTSSFFGVTFDASGNCYGATNIGGEYNLGVVWELSSAGVYRDLHDFGGKTINANGNLGNDGSYPYGGVTIDSSGDLIGTASGGGRAGGIVWKISSTGSYKDIHDFGLTVLDSSGTDISDGDSPDAGVSIDSHGNLYGTTAFGGPYSDGVLWKLSTTGVYRVIHSFGGTITYLDGTSGKDGWAPTAGITIDSSDDLFGTTSYGGEFAGSRGGEIWEFSAADQYLDLHDFGGTITLSNGSSGPDGYGPNAAVTFDSKGNMFGTTTFGGPNGNSTDEAYAFGMIWELTVTGQYKDLHDFGGVVVNTSGASGPDGQYSWASVTVDGAGNLFGTAAGGGLHYVANTDTVGGIVWEITAGGEYADLHDFGGTILNANGQTGPDGQNPQGGVWINSAGDLFGTTYSGGPNAADYNTSTAGMVWSMPHEKIASLSLSPMTIGGLGVTTGTVTLLGPAPPSGWAVGIHAGANGYLSMPATVTVPGGTNSVTFAITGLAQRPSTINMGIFATDNSSSAEAILTIQGDSLKSFTLNPSQIQWTSGTSTGTLTISSAAPPGGWNVALTPGVTGYVNMPKSVTIPAGSTTASFSMSGNAQRYFTLDLGITAADGGSKATATLIIAGDAVRSLTLSPTTIGWGGSTTATINLVVAAPPGGWLVNTHPGASGYVTMPASVTIPAGATSATFTIATGSQRSSTLTLGIYASDGPSNQAAKLTIQGDSVKSLALNPPSIKWTASSVATVSLTSPAPPGGWVLSLHAGASGYLTMPSTLTVPAGQTSATFTITAGSQRSSTINLGIFASDGNSSQEAILTIT